MSTATIESKTDKPVRKVRKDRAGDLRRALAEQGVRVRGGRIEVA